jgi:hypothetical protein
LVGPPSKAEGGRREVAGIDDEAVAARVDALVAARVSRKDAIRTVAAETGLPKNTVYGIVVGGPPRRSDTECPG